MNRTANKIFLTLITASLCLCCSSSKSSTRSQAKGHSNNSDASTHSEPSASNQNEGTISVKHGSSTTTSIITNNNVKNVNQSESEGIKLREVKFSATATQVHLPDGFNIGQVQSAAYNGSEAFFISPGLSEFFAFTPRNNTWRSIATSVPTSLKLGGGLATARYFVSIIRDNFTDHSKFYIYDITADTEWISPELDAPKSRVLYPGTSASHDVPYVIENDSLIVYPGSGAVTDHSLYILDLKSKTWHPQELSYQGDKIEVYSLGYFKSLQRGRILNRVRLEAPLRLAFAEFDKDQKAVQISTEKLSPYLHPEYQIGGIIFGQSGRGLPDASLTLMRYDLNSLKHDYLALTVKDSLNQTLPFDIFHTAKFICGGLIHYYGGSGFVEKSDLTLPGSSQLVSIDPINESYSLIPSIPNFSGWYGGNALCIGHKKHFVFGGTIKYTKSESDSYRGEAENAAYIIDINN